MIACDLGRVAVMAAVPVAWWFDALRIWHVIAVAFLLGLFSAVFDVAYQSLLPSLVDHDDLVDGNAKLQGVAAVSQIGGPAMAGFVIRALTAPYAVGVNAFTYLSSAFFLARIRHDEPRPTRAADARWGAGLARDIAEGLRFVLRHRLLRAIAAEAALANFFSAMQNAMIVYLLAGVLGIGAGTIGLLLSVASLGGLAGALAATKVAARVGEGRVLWLSLAVSSPFSVLLAFAQRGALLWVVAAAFTAVIAGSVVFGVTQVSFRQRLAPPHLLGRVNATMRFLILGSMPLGGVVGGLLGTWSVRGTLLIAAVGASLAFLPAFLSPLRRLRELPRTAV
jgi:Na+/melibiose symporter-like transporter